MKGFLRARPSALCAVAVLTLVPALAHAEDEAKPYPECTREPSDSDTTAAKAAFQAGNVSFNEADYPRAILYWEDAYRRDCTKHQMLLNLARAYELDGQKKQAVMALETFLVREQNAPDRPQITRRIEVLKKQIDNDEAAAQAAEAVSARDPGRCARSRSVSRATSRRNVERPGGLPPDPAARRGGRRRRHVHRRRRAAPHRQERRRRVR